MKTVFTLFILFLIEISVLAQVPDRISYQAVIRSHSNQLVSNQVIGIQISVLQGSIYGASIYVETQNPSTNANGLISIEIGSGIVVLGDFAAIDWANGPYFIKTETDPDGGTSYSITGISQFLSVPYALHAKTVEEANHMATENFQLNNNWLSGDGDDEGIFVRDNGYVGVMLDNPIDPLHTLGTIFSSGPNSGLKFRDRTGEEADNWIWYAKDGAAHLHRWQLGKDYISIQDDGNVGIGTKAPKGKLHVTHNLALGKDIPGQMFVIHSRSHAQGEFLHLTCDDGQGGWDWSKGFSFSRNGKFDLRGEVSVNNNSITNLANPVNDQDAATKAYVDELEAKVALMENMLIQTGVYKVLDVDNNSYNVVKIGDQVWMAENLRTTRYADGSPIPLVTNNTEWANLGDNNTDKAYCWYSNNEAGNKIPYGALYTWAAAMNGSTTQKAQGACPNGWHIPSDAEWKELEMHLGMSETDANATQMRGTNEGGKLKETGTSHWNSPNTEATNSTGFTAVPGGRRDFGNGYFFQLGNESNFCSSSGSGSGNWIRHIKFDNGGIYRNFWVKSLGYSVRCIKD